MTGPNSSGAQLLALFDLFGDNDKDLPLCTGDFDRARTFYTGRMYVHHTNLAESPNDAEKVRDLRCAGQF